MSAVATPQIVHNLPGRIRVHLPDWNGGSQQAVERQVLQFPGVRKARATGLTGNVLIQFDPAATSADSIIEQLQNIPGQVELDRQPETVDADETVPRIASPVVHHERVGALHRARITVHGIDRDPSLATRVVDHLEGKLDVAARASLVVGGAIIEWEDPDISVEDIVGAISEVELPPVEGESRPVHPLSPDPLAQSLSGVIGAGIGLAAFAIRRGFGQTGPPIASAVPEITADVLGILRGFPIIRNTARRLVGPSVGDAIFQTVGNTNLLLSGNALGLAVNEAEGMSHLAETLNRRQAWQRYEQQLGETAQLLPGTTHHAEAGDRIPFEATVRDGSAIATGNDGLPVHLVSGSRVPPGALLLSGLVTLEIESPAAVVPEPGRPPAPRSLADHYKQAGGFVSLGYALATGLVTRSLARAFEALLLVTPRIAFIGSEAADRGAISRLVRSGVVVVGTRPERVTQLPDVLVLSCPRLLTDHLEIADVRSLAKSYDRQQIVDLATAVSLATENPWGRVFRSSTPLAMTEGRVVGGNQAQATLDGKVYALSSHGHGPMELGANGSQLPAGVYQLVLSDVENDRPIGIIALRPRLAHGVDSIVERARKHGVEIGVLSGGDPTTATEIAARAGVKLYDDTDAAAFIRRRQSEGAIVAFAADDGSAAVTAFGACDLAIGIALPRTEFPGRPDLLVSTIESIADIIETGNRRNQAVRDSTLFSLAANAFGLAWGFWRRPNIGRLSTFTYIGTFVALAAGWLRLRGGEETRPAVTRIADPQPEKWGRRSIEETLALLLARPEGLSSKEATLRWSRRTDISKTPGLLDAILEQARSPLIGIMAGGALLSLFIGNIIDVAIIGATITFNIFVGAWQEHQADKTAETLRKMATPAARVLRDGQETTIPVTDLVSGDILVLVSGDRVAADARLLSSNGLEVDDAALTGESLPVVKSPHATQAEDRIVLEGSDIVTGAARAVVFATGSETRMGATAAAIAIGEYKESPLNIRLSQLLRYALPVSAGAGLLVLFSGLIRGAPLWSQLAIGSSLAIAAVPEGLPLLAKLGEASVARRLAGRNALVRRLTAVEALGRVDVACADKTGTLTTGKLALRIVGTPDEEVQLPGTLTPSLEHVLRTAALASPHPDADGAAAHPTDVAVVNGAFDAGMDSYINLERDAVSQFDSRRGYHAARVNAHVCLKGAPETLIEWCDWTRLNGEVVELDDHKRTQVLKRTEALAENGYRVLLVAEGGADTSVDDPSGLTLLGMVGIHDPLRQTVPAAVERCREAGIRVMMITGDHPKTARSIALEAGLNADEEHILTGREIAELTDDELDQRIEQITIVARATPLDKLRIVESLQRHDHTVAMTGDGVNDAPALRLADVGVAMGRGTEVARQAADVVLADDDFTSLVEILVEGRSFWQNMRRSVSMLLGGNLGELGLMAVPGLVGRNVPLVTRQILVVNMISDVAPALAIALQGPEHRDLHSLSLEGTNALEQQLRHDILRRGASTALPAIAAYLAALPLGVPVANTVGFASIIGTQLSQTLELGWSERRISPAVTAAVAGSAGLLVATIVFSPLRSILLLSPLPAAGWLLIGGSAIGAVALSRLLAIVMKAPAEATEPATTSLALTAPV